MKKISFSLLYDLFDNLPYAVAYIDQNNIYQFCNKAYKQLTALSGKNIEGRSILDILPKEIAEELLSAIQESLEIKKETCYLREINQNKQNFQCFKVKVLPFFDSATESIRVLVSEEDITLQKKSELEWQQQLINFEKSRDDANSYLESIISHFPANIYWKDKAGRILGDNLNHARMAGFKSQSEVIGKTDYDFIWKHQAEQIRENDLKVMETKQTQIFEEIGALSDGTEKIFLTIKAPLYQASNEIAGVIGISMDITERKQLENEFKIAKEKAEAANRAKSVFIANMSHDIRTPISGIIGIARMLEQEGDTKKDRDYGHIIHYSSECLLALLNDILDILSADEIREAEPKLETFSITERIQYICKLFSANAEIKHIQFKAMIDPSLPEYLITDRVKIDRILLNLISNALKFTDQGEVRVSNKLLSRDNNEAVIEFIISDTGTGIPSDKIDKIFDRFYKVTPSYESKYAGYGIGLFIVKKFVTLLGGEIKVKSELNKGTTFSVILPVKIGSKKNIKESRVDEVSPHREIATYTQHPTTMDVADHPITKGENKLRTLFIEDDDIARRTGQYFLESAGFTVQSASTGEHGVKAVKSESFDLIVSDIGLPGIDGSEFTVLVRYWERKLGRQPTPIIGLSAHVSSEIQNEVKEAGMNAVLQKPLNEKKINQMLNFLSGNAQNKQARNIDQPLEIISALRRDSLDSAAEFFQLDQYPLFDRNVALESTCRDETLLTELLSTLVSETIPQESKNLKIAHEKFDWDALQKIAHKLKGAALYCGLIKMRYACQYLEHYYLAGYGECLEDLYQQLLKILEETSQFICEYLGIAL